MGELLRRLVLGLGGDAEGGKLLVLLGLLLIENGDVCEMKVMKMKVKLNRLVLR